MYGIDPPTKHRKHWRSMWRAHPCDRCGRRTRWAGPQHGWHFCSRCWTAYWDSLATEGRSRYDYRVFRSVP